MSVILQVSCSIYLWRRWVGVDIGIKLLPLLWVCTTQCDVSLCLHSKTHPQFMHAQTGVEYQYSHMLHRVYWFFTSFSAEFYQRDCMYFCDPFWNVKHQFYIDFQFVMLIHAVVMKAWNNVTILRSRSVVAEPKCGKMRHLFYGLVPTW